MRLLLLVLVVAIAGCSAEIEPRPANDPQAVVSRDSISDFLQTAQTGDFHDMARVGQEVFKEGLRVPDHVEVFGGFATSEQRGDQVRYVFHRFRGEASVGEVSLTLAQDTGAVITFTSVEAILE